MYIVIMATNVFTINREIPICYIEYTSMPYLQRLQYHYALSQFDEPISAFHKTVKALGAKYFKWEILEKCETETEAKELLKYYQTEYKSNTIGYNAPLDESMSGENNLMYDDHRTYEEKYGKKKADEMKLKKSVSQLGRTSPHTTERNLIHNPMNDPKAREKAGKSKKGKKNPKSIYNYVLTQDNGEEIVIECVSEYCREHDGFSKTGIMAALKRGSKYKNMSVKRVYRDEGM